MMDIIFFDVNGLFFTGKNAIKTSLFVSMCLLLNCCVRLFCFSGVSARIKNSRITVVAGHSDLRIMGWGQMWWGNFRQS